MGTIEISQPVCLARIALIVGKQPQFEYGTAARSTGFVQAFRPCVAAQELQSMPESPRHTGLERIVVGDEIRLGEQRARTYSLEWESRNQVIGRVSRFPIYRIRRASQKRLVELDRSRPVRGPGSHIAHFEQIVSAKFVLDIQVIFLRPSVHRLRRKSLQKRKPA